MKTPVRTCMVIALLIVVFATACLAEQIAFGDWTGVKELDPATNVVSKSISTFAKDGISTLRLSASLSEKDQVQLTLESEKTIVSDYFSYRIDRIDTLTLHSGLKGCDGNCLTDAILKNSDLIKAMKQGRNIRVEYDSLPDTIQKPAFSLRGFSRAFQWLVTAK